MTDAKLWVGENSAGTMWVYDPNLQHDDPMMVYLYSVKNNKLVEYKKSTVTSVLSSVKKPCSKDAICKYLSWKETQGIGAVEMFKAKNEQIAEQQRLEIIERHKEVIERHKAYLKKHSKSYEGVTQDSKRQHRTTHCWSCKAGLDSNLQIGCNICGWLICYCGACGCGFKKTY